ncbi:MAG: PAS domain-containing protein [Pseudomonadota bacterium]
MFGDTTYEHSQLHGISVDPLLLEQQCVATQTIDVNGLFTTDVHSTGSFDLRSIESTSFGKLLEAVPLPIIVVDQWHHVVFSNQACERESDEGSLVGLTFEQLVPIPSDAERAQELTDKAVQVLNTAFDTRKPHTTEAILQLGRQRRWYRLHLRSMRFASHRHMLVVMEDLTMERTYQMVTRREGQRLRNQYADLKSQHGKLLEKCRAAVDKLYRETSLREIAEARVQAERDKVLRILRNTPMGLAVVGRDGAFSYANEAFKQLFGDRQESVQSGSAADNHSGDPFREIEHLINDTGGGPRKIHVVIPAEGQNPQVVQVTAERLSSGEQVIFCAHQ